MKSSPSIASLAAALTAAQSEIRTVGYDSENPHFKSKFASLTKITESVRPILAKHGLAVVQGGYGDLDVQPGVFGVETTLIHASGEWLSTFVEVPLAKKDPQGAGSALTYGRRYGLSALLSVATDEDDDANVASTAPKAAAKPQRVQAPPAVQAHRAAVADSVAAKFVMPFGESKGTPLGIMNVEKLTGALQWAREKGKYDEFQDAASVVLEAARDNFETPHPALKTPQDSLPF